MPAPAVAGLPSGSAVTDEPVSPGRRALLAASASGAYAIVDRPGAALACQPAGLAAGELRAVEDRGALAALEGVAIGARVLLAEDRRRGWFVARDRAAYTAALAADTFQAFCVASIANPKLVWVRDFTGPASLDWSGAKGDGMTDDAPFINAMLASPNVTSYRIEDQREHFAASPIRIRRRIQLIGAGPRSSIFSSEAPIDVIDASLADANQPGLHLADFGIRNRTAGTSASGSGLRLRNAHLAKITNIWIDGCHTGFHSTQSNLTNVIALHVNAFEHAGMLFDGGNNYDTRVSGFTISGKGSGAAIRLEDMCDEMIFTDGVCSSAEYALYTDAAVNVVNRRPEFCRFSRVSFDSCTNGLDLAGCVDFVFDSSFISCRPNHGAQIGVRGRTENIQFLATTFFNNAKSAAVIGPGADETDFQSCKFISNGVERAVTHDTLAFARGCGAFSIVGSRFRTGWDVKGIARHHVRIEGTGGSYLITGNSFANSDAAALLDERQAPDRRVSGNIGV